MREEYLEKFKTIEIINNRRIDNRRNNNQRSDNSNARKKNSMTIDEFLKTRCLSCVLICRSNCSHLTIFCCKQFNSSTRLFESILTYSMIKSTMTENTKATIINSKKNLKNVDENVNNQIRD